VELQKSYRKLKEELNNFKLKYNEELTAKETVKLELKLAQENYSKALRESKHLTGYI